MTSDATGEGTSCTLYQLVDVYTVNSSSWTRLAKVISASNSFSSFCDVGPSLGSETAAVSLDSTLSLNSCKYVQMRLSSHITTHTVKFVNVTTLHTLTSMAQIF